MNQHERILEMLENAGEDGVINYHFVHRHILRYSARIKELRKEGYNISTQYVTKGVYRYILDEDEN